MANSGLQNGEAWLERSFKLRLELEKRKNGLNGTSGKQVYMLEQELLMGVAHRVMRLMVHPSQTRRKTIRPRRLGLLALPTTGTTTTTTASYSIELPESPVVVSRALRFDRTLNQDVVRRIPRLGDQALSNDSTDKAYKHDMWLETTVLPSGTDRPRQTLVGICDYEVEPRQAVQTFGFQLIELMQAAGVVLPGADQIKPLSQQGVVFD